MKDDLFWLIEAHNEGLENVTDGVWWAILEDAVAYYNDENGTNYDENETVHQYLRERDNRING